MLSERRLEAKTPLDWGHYTACVCEENEYLKSLNAGLKKINSPRRFYVVFNRTAEETVTKGLFTIPSLKEFYRNIVWDFKKGEYKYPSDHEVTYLENTAEVCFSDLVSYQDINGLFDKTLSPLYSNNDVSCYTVNLGFINKFWKLTMMDLPIFIDLRTLDGTNTDLVWFDVRMSIPSEDLKKIITARRGQLTF